jgi:hypothetical protein
VLHLAPVAYFIMMNGFIGSIVSSLSVVISDGVLLRNYLCPVIQLVAHYVLDINTSRYGFDI